MKLTKQQLGLLVALLLCNATLLYTNKDWVWLRFPIAIILTFILPGLAWLPALGWLNTNRALERLLFIPAFSSLLSALALFLAVFWPGPFTEPVVMVALTTITLLGLMYQMIPSLQPHHDSSASHLEWPSKKVWLILLAILAVAAFTRLSRLGYAEFHEDELENMRLIVRAYKGEEYAPFLDSKGPIHWLLPAALWYLNGWVNEAIARTPFVLTSLLLIPMIYVLGRRLGNGKIGLIAAGFVAINGFYVAYARYVENPSLIVLWGAMTMWFIYRYYKEDHLSFLIYAALTSAIGLITHPDVLLYLPVFGYIILHKLGFKPTSWQKQWPWLLGATLLFGGLTAIFYIPYFFDPNIALIHQYFFDDRLGEALLYNRVHNMFDQDKLYSTRYHAPILITLLFWLLLRQFSQWQWRGQTVLIGLWLMMSSVILWPELWIWGSLNLAFIPYALLILLFISLTQTRLELKSLFLWFSVPLCALLFLAKDAADHIQIAYTGWALLVAFALIDLWDISGSYLKYLIVTILTATILLILPYQYLTFDAQVTTYWRAKEASAYKPNSIYNLLYGSIPRPRKLFSNPRLGGWKTVGYLWATGAMEGDFRSINESFAVPIWYTFQTPRSCYEDPQHYWVRRDWQGWPEEEQMVLEKGYHLTRIVTVDGAPKLHLYEKQIPNQPPPELDVEDYRQKFDHLATPARFARQEMEGQTTAFDFGAAEPSLRLIGYHIPSQKVQAGTLLPVTVHWRTLNPMSVRYRGFMHLIDENDHLQAQHDDDPACRLLTTEMRPGQYSSRQFRLPIAPETPPGEYKIVFGLYHPETFERLSIHNELSDQPVGDSLVLGYVTVE